MPLEKVGGTKYSNSNNAKLIDNRIHASSLVKKRQAGCYPTSFETIDGSQKVAQEPARESTRG
jgi:hypothetical protein